MESTDLTKPRRRGLRISLRVVMLLVLVTAVWMGGLVNEARRQREAVESVRRCGGNVGYDWNYVNKGKMTPTEPDAPQWLRGLLGDEYFQDVVSVTIGGTPIGVPVPGSKFTSGDDVLAHLTQLNTLKSLNMMGIRIKGKGLNIISRFKYLESFVIARSPWVSDPDITRIEALNNLKSK